ncbi:MAG: aminotransferase class III-fold pyridoxal phosphate-dependent enzyme [Balneola sp.]|nr:aminotransferase class III-fold pyridoxal phosphate-dependent enzyme [Balneola sp.]MBO6650258.1 aminotransferase class III-fold pyridoxal phosphate-dependent enzyme [Balneola sp.]MBO6712156.1 aminotransferase class III-fold pyridoxal phosphate-dependent enzyme [Balneola sp.]MBO6800350.1 aminotransferase class III-fold pyridoxal phosphate-dependent enzyme [Balneola sp.]MBO6869636.1 aminotransferase class III-fold pyridoxal phosphate-dependent enzyme [Balneola sp.]
MNILPVYPLFDVEPISANGNYVVTEDGTKYLDLYGGHAVISIGHSHPHYVKRITEQISKIGFYSNSVPIGIQKELAEKLGELSGYPDWNLFLCNSGAEANENALKMASAYNGRKKILVFEKGFHGRTSLAVAATDNPNILFPVNEGAEIVRLKLEDFKGVEEALKQEEVCAVLIEGIQGISGIHAPTPEFLKHVRTLCDQTNTVLILDEIQSGFGRTGKFFAHQHSVVEPDIISMAKGMGNGFPVGGIISHPKFEVTFGMLGTTFGGNHLACAASLAVLEVMEKENLIKHAEEMGEYLMEELKKLPKVKEVRGAGLMIGVEFEFEIAEMRKALLYKHHIFTGSSSDKNTLRLLPALGIGKRETEDFLKAIKEELS